MANITIFNLDEFALFKIAQYLDYDSLLAIICSCRTFYNIFNNMVHIIDDNKILKWKNINLITKSDLEKMIHESYDEYSTRFLAKIFAKYTISCYEYINKIKTQLDHNKNKTKYFSNIVTTNDCMYEKEKFEIILEPLLETDVFDKMIFNELNSDKPNAEQLIAVSKIYEPDLDFLIQCMELGCKRKKRKFNKIMVCFMNKYYKNYLFNNCNNCGLLFYGH